MFEAAFVRSQPMDGRVGLAERDDLGTGKGGSKQRSRTIAKTNPMDGQGGLPERVQLGAGMALIEAAFMDERINTPQRPTASMLAHRDRGRPGEE